MPVRIAVVGAGRFGVRHVATISKLQEEGLCDLVAAVDISKQQLQRLTDYECRLETSLASVLPDVDAVDIVTPASTHHQLAKQCLLANKHVIVEKPMATSFMDAVDLHNLGLERKKVVSVGHQFRYHKLTERLKEYMKAGKIGNITLIEGKFLNPNEPRQDVGSVLNYSHFVDLCNYLLDSQPYAVNCSILKSDGKTFESDALTVLDYPSGTKARLHVGWAGRRKKRYFAVEGSLTTITVDYLGQSLEILTGNPKSGILSDDLELDLTPETEPLYLELNDFLNCVETGATPLASSYSGVLSVYVCQRALQSATEHRTVPCGIQDKTFTGKLLLSTESIAAR